MLHQTITWTALPNGLTEDGTRLRLSVFVSPRLQSTDTTAVQSLSKFPDFLQWPQKMAAATFGVRFDDGTAIPATVVGPAQDPEAPADELWRAVFNTGTEVKPYVEPVVLDRPLRSFSVRNVREHVETVYQTLATETPQLKPFTRPDDPAVKPAVDALRTIALPGAQRAQVAQSLDRQLSTLQYKALLNTTVQPKRAALLPGGAARTFSSPFLARTNAPVATVPQAAVDFVQVSSFHETQTIARQVGREVGLLHPKIPAPDFHEICTHLGQYPEMLKRLRLVIELEVPLTPALMSAQWVRVVPSWQPSIANANIAPRTACRITADSFVTRSKSTGDGAESADGMLRLDDPGAFDVGQMDVDAAAIQAVDYANKVTQWVVSTSMALARGDAVPPVPTVDTSPPTLRTAGIWVARLNRALQLATQTLPLVKARNDVLKAAAARAIAGPASAQRVAAALTTTEDSQLEMYAEDLVRGWRVDVWDADAGQWYSLCRRLGTYQFRNASCRFERFYIAGFPCSPSRSSMLTGLYPHHHGVMQNDVVLDPSLPCLGNLCAAAGYDTAYFGKWHLGGNMYRDREDTRAPGMGGNWYFRRVEGAEGFKFEAVAGGVGEDAPQNGFATWTGGWKDYRAWLHEQGRDDLLKAYPAVGNHNDAPSGSDDVHAFSQLPPELHVEAFSAGRTEQYVRDHATGRPWCAVLSFYAPHHPVAPPKPWDEMYAMDQVQLPPNHRDMLEGKPLRQFNGDTYRLPKWSDDQFKDYIRRYWGYCSYIDSQIGRVFSALRETGQWDNTIVIFTSDHGDMVGAHGMIHKLGTCGYEELYRVPTMVHIPGVTQAGSRRSQLASNIDLLPTILEAARIARPQKLDGQSLIPVLRDAAAPGREAIFSDCSDVTLVARDERFKFVLNWRRRDVDELYDLQADPWEMRNLAADPAHKMQVQAQRDRVLAWTRDAGHPFAALIAAEAARETTMQVMQMRPRVEEVKYLGGNEFEIEAIWHVDKPIAPEGKYWCFFQFLRGNSSEITFRTTPWPDPPATQWEAGRDYKVGPVKVTIPDTAPAGNYRVRVGLYDPDRKVGPGVITGGDGNALTVGTLTVKRQDGRVSAVSFIAAP